MTLLQAWVPDPYTIYGSATPWAGRSRSRCSSTRSSRSSSGRSCGSIATGWPWLLVGAVALSDPSWPLLLRPEQQDAGVAFWSIYISPLYRLLEFVAGIALAGLLRAGVRTREFRSRSPWRSSSWPTWKPRSCRCGPAGSPWTIVPFCLLIFVCAQADVPVGARACGIHGLIRLGQWSFAFYLVHQLILRVVNVNLVPVT